MRYTIMAAAVAIMLLGIMSVAAFTPRQPEMAQPQAPTQQPALETFYVPAQHVNAATLGGPIEEPVLEFY
jgi:hypothetical protein